MAERYFPTTPPHRWRRAAAFMALCALMALGCQRVGQPGPAAPAPTGPGEERPTGVAPAQVAGTWDVVLRIEGDPTEIHGILVLEQEGRELRGNFSSTLGISANGSGTMDGREMTFVFSYDLECAGTAAMVGTLEDGSDRMQGNISASDCTGEVRGTFQLSRGRG